MQKIILLVLLLALNAQLWANPIEVKTTNALVYRSGVQLKQSATLNLKAGLNQVVLYGLSNHVEEASLRLKSTSSQVVLMGISLKQNYLNPNLESPKMQTLMDSLEIVREQLGIENRKLELASAERELLNKNKEVAGDNNGIQVAELEKLYAFYARKFENILERTAQIAKQQKKLNDVITRLNNQISEERRIINRSRNEVHIEIDAKAAGNYPVELVYFSNSASWSSNYELRAIDGKAEIILVQKAEVIQSTGLDWVNIPVTFSTGNPNRSTLIPPFSAWYLRYYVPIPAPKSGKYKAEERGVTYDSDGDGVADEFDAEPNAAPGAIVYSKPRLLNVSTPQFEENDNTLATEYSTQGNQNLQSGQKRSIRLTTYTLPAEYRHYSIPRLQPNVYIQAIVTGYESLSLQAGPLSLYLEDNFVGNSYFNPLVTNDSLEISFGIDEKVSVKYELLKEKNSTAFIGTNKTRKFDKRITVKNNRKDVINLVVVDQIPKSVEKDIEVTHDAKGAEYEETSGKLTFKEKLDPAKSKVFEFNYTVKHPKNKVVSGL